MTWAAGKLADQAVAAMSAYPATLMTDNATTRAAYPATNLKLGTWLSSRNVEAVLCTRLVFPVVKACTSLDRGIL